MKRSRRGRIPIIAQWEVVYAIWEIDNDWYVNHVSQVDALWPPAEGYFVIRDVKIMSKEMMLARGRKRPLEIAHPAMTARAVPVIWKLGINPVVEPVSIFSFWKHALWVWDKKSIQPWTHAFFQLPDLDLTVVKYIKALVFEVWVSREGLGRVHHILHRWVGLLPPAVA